MFKLKELFVTTCAAVAMIACGQNDVKPAPELYFERPADYMVSVPAHLFIQSAKVIFADERAARHIEKMGGFSSWSDDVIAADKARLSNMSDADLDVAFNFDSFFRVLEINSSDAIRAVTFRVHVDLDSVKETLGAEMAQRTKEFLDKWKPEPEYGMIFDSQDIMKGFEANCKIDKNGKMTCHKNS